jgi:ribosomal protein S18 acetylase RimI-like enzyme
MISYTIRKGTEDDLQLAYDIRKNALGEYVKQTWGWNEEWQWEYHLKDFDPLILHVIEIEEIPVGTFEIIYERHSILVSGIYIIDKYQSQGIGAEVMESIIGQAKKEKKSVKLQVLKVNKRAKDFYLKLGFEKYAENEFHYQMIYNKQR